MRVADTSVLVAGFASWHEAHAPARRALSGCATLGHCLLETYSVLTRLPPPHRVRPDVAAEWLDRVVTDAPLVLDPADLRDLPRTLSDAGVTGGATYDALVATTAMRHGAELLSLNLRALSIYRTIGVRHRLLSP